MVELGVKSRSGRSLPIWLAVVVFVGIVSSPVLAGEPGVVETDQAKVIPVQIDRARLIHLPPGAATVVIGNPLIADITVQPDGLGVVTGKGYGETNAIVLNRDNVEMAKWLLEVEGPSGPTVVVYRGTDRETYSCTPECMPRITLGDDPDYFNKTLSASTARNSQASASGAKH
jgi:Flp pilus assembly secretin CpaC